MHSIIGVKVTSYFFLKQPFELYESDRIKFLTLIHARITCIILGKTAIFFNGHLSKAEVWQLIFVLYGPI